MYLHGQIAFPSSLHKTLPYYAIGVFSLILHKNFKLDLFINKISLFNLYPVLLFDNSY